VSKEVALKSAQLRERGYFAGLGVVIGRMEGVDTASSVSGDGAELVPSGLL
jgi:hypothetical protein